MEFFDPLARHCAVFLAETEFLPFADCASVHASHCDTSHIIAEVKTCDEHLRIALKLCGSRDIVDYRIKHRGDVLFRLTPVRRHPVLLRRTVYRRKIKLVFRSVEIEHQVENHFIHFIGTTVRLVNLVYHNNRLQTHLNSFLQHETSLGHRSLECIYKQQTAVCHIEHTLHLTSEIRVSGSVYDIDLRALIID